MGISAKTLVHTLRTGLGFGTPLTCKDIAQAIVAAYRGLSGPKLVSNTEPLIAAAVDEVYRLPGQKLSKGDYHARVATEVLGTLWGMQRWWKVRKRRNWEK